MKSRLDKIQSITNSSRDLIRENNLKGALSLLSKTTELTDFRDEIINLESRLSRLNNTGNLGLITYEQETINKNKLLKSLTDLLVKIEQAFDYK